MTSLSQALGFLPDLHIHASLVLCALVIIGMTALYRRAHAPQKTRRPRRKTMSSSTQSPTAPVQEQSASGPHRSVVSRARSARPAQGSTSATPKLRIHWDRAAIAAAGALGLLIALLAFVAGIFGAAAWGAVFVGILVAAVAVVVLRLLAISDRRRRADRRIEAAFEEAQSPVYAEDTAVFDAAAEGPHAVRQSTAPARTAGHGHDDAAPSSPSSAEVRRPAAAESARAEDAESATEQTESAPESRSAAGSSAAGSLSVPRPTYLDAPEAVRAQPEPLQTQTPAPLNRGTSLKSGVSAEYAAQVEATARRPLDLDKVLERRRVG